MKKITPFLWFDKNAQEAAEFYVSVFKNSKILNQEKSPSDNPSTKAGEVIVVEVELDGNVFQLINGGPYFKFTEAISFVIDCDGQEEVDYYWDALTADGGQESQCGWLKDKFGLSWQVTPKQLMELVNGPDKAKSKKAFDAMMGMKKIVIADLEKAVNS